MALPIGLGTKKFVAVDWDARDVRVVSFRARAEGIDLLKAVSVPIPANVSVSDAESLGAFLRQVLRQAKISAKQALLTVPRDRVVLNPLSFPPTPAEELAAMVRFQVAKELPFAADRATIDFIVNGAFDAKAPCELLVAAVRNEEIAYYRDVGREAGLSVQDIGLRPHGNLVAISASGSEVSSGTLLIVEVGPGLTEIDVVRDGVLAFSRAASVSLADLWAGRQDRVEDSRIVSTAVREHPRDDATKRAVDAVLMEVTRSYEAYRATDPSLRVERVIVAGASGIEAELAESLSSRFGVRGELYAPGQALSLTEKRSRELRGFSAVLGLAMGHGGHGLAHFDFLHPKRPSSKRSRRMKKAPVAAAAAVLFIAAGVAGRINYVNPELREADRLRKEVSIRKKEAEAVRKFKAKVDAIGDWQRSEQCWPEVLGRLTEAFPPSQEAYATRVIFETRKPRRKSRLSVSSVQIQLRTESSTSVNVLSERMRELGFANVTPGNTARTTSSDGYRYDTKLDAVIPLRKHSEKPAPVDHGEPPATDTSPDSADRSPEGGSPPPATKPEAAAASQPVEDSKPSKAGAP